MRKSLLAAVGLLFVHAQLQAETGTMPPPAAAVDHQTTVAPAETPAAAPTPSPAPIAPAIPSLSGQWSSSFTDKISIEQMGDNIIGRYQYTDDNNVTQDGRIEGTIKGMIIQGKWLERPLVGGGEESRGDLEWKLVDDGRAMMGWYREEGDDKKFDWNLTR